MMDVEGTIARFVKHRKALNRSADDWTVCMLKRFFDFIADRGINDLNNVTETVILRYQYHVSMLTSRRGDCYCVRVQNQHVSTVKLLFKYLRMTGEAVVDPCSSIEYAKEPKTLPKDIVSVSEIIMLIESPDTDSIEGVRDRAILEILYSTGIRRNELLGLDINDIYFDDQRMRVDGKGDRERMVPFGKTASLWLRRYLDEARPSFVKESSGEAVFLSRKGGRRMGKQGIKHVVDKYARMVGLEHRVTPHIVRHCCATHLLDNGADVRHLQELLGHEKLSTTALYTRVSITKLKQVHAKFHPREHMAA